MSCEDPASAIIQVVYIGESWCSERQCCAPAANDDADFKNGPPPRKKLKLTLGKGKEKVTVEHRFSMCSVSELETA